MLVKDFVDVYQKGDGYLRVIIDDEEISGSSAYMRNYYADYDIDNITVGKDGYIVLYISFIIERDSVREKYPLPPLFFLTEMLYIFADNVYSWNIACALRDDDVCISLRGFYELLVHRL